METDQYGACKSVMIVNIQTRVHVFQEPVLLIIAFKWIASK